MAAALAALMLSAFLPTVGHAIDLEAASGRFGVAVLNNTAPTAPSPILNTLGGSAIVSFAAGLPLTLEPGIDLYWANYEWFDGRAVPTETERGQGNNVFVLGFLVDLPLYVTVRFNERLSGAFGLGPAFNLRTSFAGDTTAGFEPEMAANLASVSSYFWREGRWFMPAAAVRFHVFLQEGFTFAVGVKGFLPVYNAWAGDAPFWDHTILQVNLSMRLSIGKKPVPEPVPAEPTPEAVAEPVPDVPATGP